MPEVKDLSEALPETTMDPITGVGVVASRNRAPTGYDVVSWGYSFILGRQTEQVHVCWLQELLAWELLPCRNFKKTGREEEWVGVGFCSCVCKQTLWVSFASWPCTWSMWIIPSF